MNSRHFRLTRLALARGYKAEPQPDGSFRVKSRRARPGHPWTVTTERCDCPALLSCVHLELVRKIVAESDTEAPAYWRYSNARRADWLRFNLRLLRGKLSATDREYLNYCASLRPSRVVNVESQVESRRARAAEAFGETFAAKVFA